MLCSTRQLKGLEIAARDGSLGKVEEAYFDDDRWTLRHLVVRTGSWFSGRHVLISPHAVERIDLAAGQVVVALTRQQVEQAPDIDTDKPVSRQHEASYYDHYGYPYYWGGSGLWGASTLPLGVVTPTVPGAESPAGESGFGELGPGTGAAPALSGQPEESGEGGDPHLRSTAEVTGYTVEASDGRIGHVDDFLFEPASWAIRKLVVDTRHWLPGRKVLVEPTAIERMDWSGRRLHVALTREAVEGSPGYEAGGSSEG